MLIHNDNLEKKEKVKYDLYKILRMSILLNQTEVDKLTLEKFREASLSIDKMLGEAYDEKLESMFYETSTLQEEAERLKDLVAFINERLEKRKNLLDDYRSVTNRELSGLDYISKSNDLDLFEERLKIIKDYLDNSKLIEVNEKDLEIIKEELIKEYDIKSSNEIKNAKIEENLFNTFVNCLYEMDLYSSLGLSHADKEIEKLQDEINETKEQKDTFESAFNNLKLSGISGELELEYASYVENSRRNYYYVKEKEILLKLYKLIEEKESEYVNIFKKREDVKNLLDERLMLRKELNIKDKDLMYSVIDLVEDQKLEIDSEKENIDNINILIERIKLKEHRLEELKRLVEKPEILSILNEFSLIDTYNHGDVIEDDFDDENILLEETNQEEENNDDNLVLLSDLLPEEENSNSNADIDTDIVEQEEVENEKEKDNESPAEINEENETIEEEVKEEKVYLPNQIKESLMVPTMNFGLSRLKSISVMKRVGDMLGINVKSSETKTIEPEEPKTEEKTNEPVVDLFVENDTSEPIFVNENKQNTTPADNKEEELFWTPNEFLEMKNEVEEDKKEVISANNVINSSNNIVDENSIFEFKMPEIKEEPKDNKNNQLGDNGVKNDLIFPEPVMPDLNIFPENKEDKFMWPESAETFDINGIFPS